MPLPDPFTLLQVTPELETGGAEEITLTTNQIPAHSHPLLASSRAADSGQPSGRVFGAARPGADLYIEDTNAVDDNPDTNCAPTAITSVGGSQPHSNFQPYLCVDYIISLYGIFPSPT